MEKGEKRRIKVRYIALAVIVAGILFWPKAPAKQGSNSLKDWFDGIFNPNQNITEELPSPNRLKTNQLLEYKAKAKTEDAIVAFFHKLANHAQVYKNGNSEEALEDLTNIKNVAREFKFLDQPLNGFYYENMKVENQRMVMESINIIQGLYKDFDTDTITDNDVFWGTFNYLGSSMFSKK